MLPPEVAHSQIFSNGVYVRSQLGGSKRIRGDRLQRNRVLNRAGCVDTPGEGPVRCNDRGWILQGLESSSLEELDDDFAGLYFIVALDLVAR